ncbi:CD209 antigen-like protein C [Solea solea]|uniref:CD209 antigen-like protein C n=1 Tax=Solea solea TaxID=90069 RepID=UPI00272A20BD|nr:CD209 antigen-like protein C [Solea solea]
MDKDMDAIYANDEFIKCVRHTCSEVDSGAKRSQTTRSHGAAAAAVYLSLVLLSAFLLAALVGLGVHHHDSAQHWAAVTVNLAERLQVAENKRDLLTDELANKTKELQEFQSRIPHLMPCPNGWTMFQSSCYFLSSTSGSWDHGKSDCRKRGADLVIISNTEEQKFMSKLSPHDIWIGLSDREHENTWEWTDGSPLTLRFWRNQQPDNGNGDARYGEEDCGTLLAKKDVNTNWNDLSCDASLHWICEKKALILSEI